MSGMELALVEGDNSFLAHSYETLREHDRGEFKLPPEWMVAAVEFRFDPRAYTYTLIVDVELDGKKISYSLFTVTDTMMLHAYNPRDILWAHVIKLGKGAMESGDMNKMCACLVAATVMRRNWTNT
jgi:hypothetical protein